MTATHKLERQRITEELHRYTDPVSAINLAKQYIRDRDEFGLPYTDAASAALWIADHEGLSPKPEWHPGR